ncbi:MAG: hypothetical protein AAF413_02460 [Patescibacteria group bacterium]
MNQTTTKAAGALVISAALILGVYLAVATLGDDPVAVDTASTSSQPDQANVPTNTVIKYADGTYSATKTYRVPEGHTDEISIELSLKDDVISSIVVDTVATNNESVEHQDKFDPLIVGEVEGKSLDEADISRLGGASLTSSAFNDLLQAVRNEAQT